MELLRHDPLEHIDSVAWLELDESERKQLVVRYHRLQRIQVPNEIAHALIHVMVENQLALGDAFPTKAVLLRLMDEGLDRHEASTPLVQYNLKLSSMRFARRKSIAI